MFAGAARAAVFSNPEVIRRVNAEFVPVALKAALVNNPPGDAEGQLYQEIARSEPERQGICVVNSAGKVLDWTLTFDDDQSVLAFLDHALQRFHEYPDAMRRVTAERYVKYPSLKLPDVPDSGQILAVPDHHAGTSCPAQARFPEGTIIGREFGRALGPDGTPVADTIRQEQYIEDRFELPVEAQELLTRELSDAGATRFELPRELARLFASHTYLGQLDVNPLGSPAGGSGEFKTCEFWAQRVSAGANGPVRLRVEGQSEIAGSQDEARPEEGGERRVWQHEVKLAWVGFIEMRGDRVTHLLLAARGSEKLKWGNAVFHGESEVSHLPAGRPIDLACGVCYGIIGEPVAASEVGPADPNAPPPGAAGVQARLQQKIRQIESGVQRWQRQGRDPSSVGEIMQGFEPLMRQGQIHAAEAVLDRALKVLDGTERGSVEK